MKSNQEINWEQQKTLLKIRYPELTDRDLDYDEGQIDLMLSHLSEKLGKPQSEFHPTIHSKNEEVSGETIYPSE